MKTIYVDSTRTNANEVARYLPSNYRLTSKVTDTGEFVVEGEDHAGWTAEGYVIPRLQSGWISAKLADDGIEPERRDCPHFDMG